MVADVCESNRCDPNADCIPVGESYRCRCQEGYEGDGITCNGKIILLLSLCFCFNYSNIEVSGAVSAVSGYAVFKIMFANPF